MKRKLTVLGLIFLLSFSARASVVIAVDVHSVGNYAFVIDSNYTTAYASNLVFYKVEYWLGSSSGSGGAIIFYDTAYSTIKIIGFGYSPAPYYEYDNSLMIEAHWPDLTQSASGVATFGLSRLESATLRLESGGSVQGSDRPAPARTERSGDGLLLPDRDLTSVIPEESGLQSLDYKYILKGTIPDSPLYTYFFYVLDLIYSSPEFGYSVYPVIMDLNYNDQPWLTAEGLLFVRPWTIDTETGERALAVFLTTFKTSVLYSMSLTDKYFLGDDNDYLIDHRGSYGKMRLRVVYP